MPNAYTHFVLWVSRGIRHHGSAAVDIATPPPPSVMATGDVFQAPWAPPTISWVDSNNQAKNAKFGFWSIVGGTGGPIVTTANTPPTTNVGTNDIIATAWYILGNGNGQPGIFVDTFDVDLGTFVDDVFATVKPDANGTLTTSANIDGFVPTATREDIFAYLSIHMTPFVDWKVVVGSEAVTNEDLQAKAQDFAVAFAFYQLGKTPPYVIPWEDMRAVNIQLQPFFAGPLLDIWLKEEPIGELIQKYSLKPMPAKVERTFAVQAPTSAARVVMSCGIKVPHLHYKGKTYLLSTEQWNEFSRMVQKDLSKKLTKAKTVTFSKLMEMSNAVGELP